MFILNKLQLIKQKKIIIEYSAKKNKTNPPEPYSTLNPEINSLSPSEKSKGARLVSANIVINQIRKIGNRLINNNNSTIK